MPILDIVSPKEAEGVVAENYSLFNKSLGMVPLPFQMFSPSPDLQSMQKGILWYFFRHPRLSPALLALIRLSIAHDSGYDYCVMLNSRYLRSVGLGDGDELARIMDDPEKAPIKESEKRLLGFVIRAVTNPASTKASDIDELRQMGWSDGDILDAMYHGANMVMSDILYKATKMGDSAVC